MNPVSPGVLFSRMEVARRETYHHLNVVHRQIAVRAERLAVTEKAKARNRTQKRSGSRWTRSDEVLFQDRAITTLRLKLGEVAWRQAA